MADTTVASTSYILSLLSPLFTQKEFKDTSPMSESEVPPLEVTSRLTIKICTSFCPFE
jgi:hypothetical protein